MSSFLWLLHIVQPASFSHPCTVYLFSLFFLLYLLPSKILCSHPHHLRGTSFGTSGTPKSANAQRRVKVDVLVLLLSYKENEKKWKSLIHVWPFVTPWTVPTRLLCMLNHPGKNTGVGSLSLPWGSSWPRPWTLHCRRIFTVWATGKHSSAQESYKNGSTVGSLSLLIPCQLGGWMEILDTVSLSFLSFPLSSLPLK